MSADFAILSMDPVVGLFTGAGHQVYQGRVQFFDTQIVVPYDDRWGSWQSSKEDEMGRRKEPSAILAAHLQSRKLAVDKSGEHNPFMIVDNPTIKSTKKQMKKNIEDAAIDNPFFSASDNPFITS